MIAGGKNQLGLKRHDFGPVARGRIGIRPY